MACSLFDADSLSGPKMFIVYWTADNKLQLNCLQNKRNFVQENAFHRSSAKWRTCCIGLNMLRISGLIAGSWMPLDHTDKKLTLAWANAWAINPGHNIIHPERYISIANMIPFVNMISNLSLSVLIVLQNIYWSETGGCSEGLLWFIDIIKEEFLPCFFDNSISNPVFIHLRKIHISSAMHMDWNLVHLSLIMFYISH